jgi:hypothetical protein
MTTTASTTRTTTGLAPVAIGVTVATLALDAFGVWGYGTTDDDAAIQMLVIGLLTLASAGVVFGLVLPRALRRGTAGRTGLVLSAIALLIAVPLFWSGVAPVLAVGGIVAGRADRGRMATAAFVVGILALIGCLGTYVGDWLSHV